MGLGRFLLGLIGSAGSGAVSSAVGLTTVSGPVGAAVGAGLFAATYFLNAFRERDRPPSLGTTGSAE